MKPTQASRALREIADKIDRSSRPDRRLVTAAMQRVLTAMTMQKVVYVQWEGRGYSEDSWAEDKAVIQDALGDGPCWVCGFNTGMLFSSAPPTGGVDLIQTRHGETHESTGVALEDAFMASVGYDQDDSSALERWRDLVHEQASAESWEKHKDFSTWEQHARDTDILSELEK